MRLFLFIFLFVQLFASTAQTTGATVGTILRSLSGGDMMTGEVIDIEFSQSPKYTLLHFWRSASDSCIKDFPGLLKLVNGYKERLVVYGFPYEYKQDIPSAKNTVNRFKLYWAQLLQYRQTGTQGANVIDVLGVNEFPVYMLLNKRGAVVVRSVSLLDIEVVLKRNEED